MKLKTIYIKNFGKLKNFRLDLVPGLNVIYGNNESGKTTVMNFIKMMFYGTSGKSSDIGKNLRKKYSPWDGSPMSGFIEFESGGQNYRLERGFGSSNITDEVVIWNLSTGVTEPTSCKFEPGERFMGMNSSTFERSVFIGDTSAVINGTDREDEISRKLINFSSSAEENISYEIVRKRLQKAHDDLRSKSRKNGEIDKLVAELSEKTERLAKAEDEEQKRRADEELYALNMERLEKKKTYRSRIEKQIKEQRIIRELHALEIQSRKNAVKAELQKKIDDLTVSITNGDFTVTESFLDECSEMLSALFRIKENYSEKKSEFNRLSVEISDMKLPESIDECEADLSLTEEEISLIRKEVETLQSDLAAVGTSKDEVTALIKETQIKEELYNERIADMEPNYVVLIPSALMIVAAIALFLKNAWFLLSAIPVCAAVILGSKLVGVIEDYIEKRYGVEHDDPDFEELYSKYNAEIEDLNGKSTELDEKIIKENEKLEDTEAKKADIEQKTNQLKLLKEQKDSDLNRLNSELNKTGNDITELDYQLTKTFSAYRPAASAAEIPDMIDEALDTITEIEKTRAVLESKHEEDTITDPPELIELRSAQLKEKLELITGGSGPRLLSDSETDLLEEKLDSADNEISALKDELASIRSGITARFNSSEDASVLREKIDILKQKIAGRLKYDRELLIASEVMAEAGNEIRQTFAPELNSKTEKIFAHLTGGKYTKAIVSKDLAITPAENGDPSLREWQYLSTGTVEQAYLSLRLALSDMMAGNKIPVFLDDVFAHFDEERTRKGFLFLNEYSKLDQVIFFTCHRYSMIDDQCISFPEQ